MERTLENNSGIFLLKSKFFLYRIISYFSFLLLPVFVQKSLFLNEGLQSGIMAFYILFMMSQWFLLGKEIDHRFKIYFRVNSSMDRVIYRLLLGMLFFIIFFNILSLFPGKWIYNLFWTTWVILGLFYSWPTRGKIIQESVTTNFSEFKYLDSFEKTLLGISSLLFIFSLPELPKVVGMEQLKLFLDPLEKVSPVFWNFLKVNYYPFFKYPNLFKVSWCMHFYLVGMGFFLLVFYAFLRFFVSRRLSILGVFALLSSWSFSKMLGNNFGTSIITSYSIFYIWAGLWVTKSSTYRAGLFLGLIGFLGVIINQSIAPLIFIQIVLLYTVFLKEKTVWFKIQLLKYSLPGLFLILMVILFNYNLTFPPIIDFDFLKLISIQEIVSRKAFFSLSIFGLVFLLLFLWNPKLGIIKNFEFNRERIIQTLAFGLIFFLYSILFDPYILKDFGIMWFVVFLSLLPLEILFQSLSRLRSRRNIIYVIYILICLLDSHFEGRIKIFLKLFES